MFRKFAEWAIARVIKLGYIADEDSEEYIYGFDLILSVIVSDIAMVTIGIIMHMVLESVIFTFMYKCIRKYTGGFHCETALTCIISSCFMCVCVLLAIKYFPYNFIIYTTVTIILLAVLFVMSPIEAINKPLDETEVKVFGRRARIVICTVLVIYTVVCILGWYNIAKVMAISIADITLFAIMGKIKLSYHQRKYQKIMLK